MCGDEKACGGGYGCAGAGDVSAVLVFRISPRQLRAPQHGAFFNALLFQLYAHRSCKWAGIGFINIGDTQLRGVGLVARSHGGYDLDTALRCRLDKRRLCGDVVDTIGNIIALAEGIDYLRRILCGHEFLDGDDFRCGRDAFCAIYGGIAFMLAYIIKGGKYLAVEVRFVHRVAINGADSGNTESAQRLKNVSANTTKAEKQNPCLRELFRIFLAQNTFRAVVYRFVYISHMSSPDGKFPYYFISRGEICQVGADSVYARVTVNGVYVSNVTATLKNDIEGA